MPVLTPTPLEHGVQSFLPTRMTVVIHASHGRPQLLQKQRCAVPHQQQLRQLHHPCDRRQDVSRAYRVSPITILRDSGSHGAVSI